MGFAGRRKVRIGDILVNEGLISQEALDRALDLQKIQKKKLGEILVSEGFLTEEAMADALHHQLGIDRIELNGIIIPEEITALFDSEILKKYRAMPVMYDPKI